MTFPPLVEPANRLSPDEQLRTSRQTRLPQIGTVGQRRLQAARVCVLGAGGLGAPALLYLAAAGVGTIGIVDDDTVDESNLQRQVIHGIDDVGHPKVASARTRVLELAPEASVVVYRQRLTDENAPTIFAAYDLVLDGTDNFDTRYLVADACARAGIPLVWASVLRFDAQISLFWSRPPTGHDPVTLRDVFPHPPAPGEVPSCAEAGVLGALCGQVGSIMAAEAVKLICGIGDPLLGRMLVVDALATRTRELPVRQRAGAAATSEQEPAQSRAPKPAPSPSITADELLVRRAQVALIDVREPDEHTQGVIPGAILLPLDQVLARLSAGTAHTTSGTDDAAASPIEGVDHDSPVVVYCHRGPRADLAATELRANGFTDVVTLDGGMIAWRAGGHPLAAPAFSHAHSHAHSGSATV
ncbi:ThiF family adenylyltransferase [Okibacterium endophyticum]